MFYTSPGFLPYLSWSTLARMQWCSAKAKKQDLRWPQIVNPPSYCSGHWHYGQRNAIYPMIGLFIYLSTNLPYLICLSTSIYGIIHLSTLSMCLSSKSWQFSTNPIPPKKLRCSLKRNHSKKERIVLQSSFFRSRAMLVFGGVDL